MKAKPDLSSFRPPAKDPSAFIEGDDTSERRTSVPASTPVAAQPEAGVQLNIRVSMDVLDALKEYVFEQSKKKIRVTQSQVVERLLRDFLASKLAK